MNNITFSMLNNIYMNHILFLAIFAIVVILIFHCYTCNDGMENYANININVEKYIPDYYGFSYPFYGSTPFVWNNPTRWYGGMGYPWYMSMGGYFNNFSYW